jgi:predicted permease
MPAPEAKGQRLVALFILGCLLFNYPVLSLFNVAADVLGVPVLYAYIFAAWALLVALMALVVESRR